MLDITPRNQADQPCYPTEGVVVGINHHNQTLGKHRVRISFSPEVVKVLGRGLFDPRLHIDGTFVNGLRVWCEQAGGLTLSRQGNAGTCAVSMPVRRVRAREALVTSMDVSFEWQLDDTGPVLLIPRFPDVLLPEAVIDKLPNGAVDPETRDDRTVRRLQREWAKIELETGGPPPGLVRFLNPAPQTAAPDDLTQDDDAPGLDILPVEPPSAPAEDLKYALTMVNELVDQLGTEVVLSIDANGHVHAKRRIIQYIDL